MKNANGFGSVYKMSGRRRRPYRAVITIGHSSDGNQIRKTLGYYATKKEALSALGVYHSAPYSLDALRFEDIYRMWSEEHYPEISRSAIDGYKNAYNHSAAIHRKRFAELRTLDLENCIKAEATTPHVQTQMKGLYNSLWKYALRYDYTSRNYAAEVKIDKLPVTTRRNPFTHSEIGRLWELNKDESLSKIEHRAVRMILIGIYSGWRPQELCSFELDGDLMRGGVKTANGKDRVVPVHEKIKELVTQERSNYPIYHRNFKKLMEMLGWEHTPHDTRRTFATLAAEARMDEHIRKLIMGHANPDLTERLYTTHTICELQREIAKIG